MLWYILMMAAALTVCSIALFARRLSRCTFLCKPCGETFHIPWTRALFVQHFNRDYILRCPRCGQKGWCAATPSERGG